MGPVLACHGTDISSGTLAGRECGATGYFDRGNSAWEYLQIRQGDVNRAAGQSDEMVSFVIEQGETAAAVSSNLAQAGLLTDPDLFNLYMRHNQLDSKLEAGNYLLRANMTMPEIAESLQHSTVDEVVFTVPEGWRMEQVAEHLAANDIVDAQEFITFVRQGITQEGLSTKYPFLAERPPGASSSLEGFLFPDTYRVPRDSGVQTIVQVMLDNFGRRFDQRMRDAVKQQNKSIYDVVTLAAIVEREAVIPDERPVIASVYLNRLSQGKALESDPTVHMRWAISQTRSNGGRRRCRWKIWLGWIRSGTLT